MRRGATDGPAARAAATGLRGLDSFALPVGVCGSMLRRRAAAVRPHRGPSDGASVALPGGSHVAAGRACSGRAAGRRLGSRRLLLVYFGGIFAGLVLATIGFAISGDKAGHAGALTDGLTFLGQFGGWLAGLMFVSRRKGRGTLRADFGLMVHLRDAWVIAARGRARDRAGDPDPARSCTSSTTSTRTS